MCSNGKIITAEEFVNPSNDIIPSNLKKKEDKMDINLKVSQIPDIRGFSYSFCRTLLGILKELEKKDKIVEGGIAQIERSRQLSFPSVNDTFEFTLDVQIVIGLLQKQLNFDLKLPLSVSKIKQFGKAVERLLDRIAKAEADPSSGSIERL